MSSRFFTGRVHRINVSRGGVPKRPVQAAAITTTGVDGDAQAHPQLHGGEARAVSLLGLDVIERLRAAGHPIEPGSTGENVTLEGLDWAAVPLGARFHFAGGVVLEALSFATPCSTIRASFLEDRIDLLLHDRYPGQSRIYARVLQAGELRSGESVRVEVESARP